MERELWTLIVSSLRSLPRRSMRNAVYTDSQILAVLLWAALHHRPVNWACLRKNWPAQAWRRVLPDQSTMSRRLRDPAMARIMRKLVQHLQRRLPEGRLMLTDGKAFTLKESTRDPDALVGRMAGRYFHGYKLHAIVDDGHRVCAWSIQPLNHAEQPECRSLLEQLGKDQSRGRRFLLADAGYNSNALFCAARDVGLRLIAPRCKPGTGLGWRKHDRDRLSSVRLTEGRGGWMWRMLYSLRIGVERYFSGLSSGIVSGDHLPIWARRLHRVRYWLDAKVIINAARITRNHMIHA